jgi:WD40 repeat protein
VGWGKQPRHLKDAKEEVMAVAFSPDGKYLAASDWGHRITLWDWRAAGALTEGGPP